MSRRSRGIQVKTPEQVLLMRAAGLLVGRTLEVLRAAVRPGVTTAELDTLAETHIRDHGGVPSFLGYHGFTGTICASVNDEVVHGIPGARVLGAVTLNRAIGGMNALAVEIAAREGARIVWMPTVDSPAETAGRSDPRPGDKVPQWAKLQHELRELGLGVEPVHVTDPEGRVLPETRDVLRAIARHGLILASAHLARDDTFAVVEAAFEEGVKHVVVTHPEFTCQRFTIEDQVALADRGCLIERCLTTPHSGKTSFEHVFDGVRAVGLERNFFSSDLGNPDYPPVEDGLALWADRLLGAGFGEDETREMIVAGSRRVAGER